MSWRGLFPTVSGGGQGRFSVQYRRANGDTTLTRLASHQHPGLLIFKPSELSASSCCLFSRGPRKHKQLPTGNMLPFLHRHSVLGEPNSMETDQRGCVYGISSRPTPLLLRSWRAAAYLPGGSVVICSLLHNRPESLNHGIIRKEREPQSLLSGLLRPFYRRGNCFLV